MTKYKQTKRTRVYRWLADFVSSGRFFTATLFFFIVESTWVAVSAVYPGAFDEDTHTGIIKFFSSHPNPFFSHQPDYLNQFGPVVHNPSYLYHFLMSFPWRIITSLTDNFTIQIITMRLINISLFALGLIIFRGVLLKVTKSQTLVNIALLLVVLTPLVVQLAAQINYDNMLFVLIAVNLLLVIELVQHLDKGRFDLIRFSLFIGFSLLASLVKSSFLPLLVGMIIYLFWHLFKSFKSNRTKLIKDIKSEYLGLSLTKKALIILFVALSFGLFFERYGMDIWRYHSPQPSCVQVLGRTSCQNFSIYQREINYAATKPAVINKNPIRFTYLWLKHMEFNLMMVINGKDQAYATGLPLPLPNIAIIVLATGGIILVVLFWRQLFKHPHIKLFAISMFFYLALLYVTNYSSYLNTGRRVAVQGRYLVPLLPMLYLIFLQAYKYLLQQWPKLQMTAASILVFCLLAGGGVITFIVHSDSSWYWQGNQAAINLNHNAQNILRPIIPGSHFTPYYQSSLDF